MSAARFLRDHWQKRPLLVRGAFPTFAIRSRRTSSRDSRARPASNRDSCGKGGRRPWEVVYGPHDEAAFARSRSAAGRSLFRRSTAGSPSSAPPRPVRVPTQRPGRRRDGELRRSRRKRRSAPRQLRRVPRARAGRTPLALRRAADEEHQLSRGARPPDPRALRARRRRGARPRRHALSPAGLRASRRRGHPVPDVLDRLSCAERRRTMELVRGARRAHEPRCSPVSSTIRRSTRPPIRARSRPRSCARIRSWFARSTPPTTRSIRWFASFATRLKPGPRAHGADEPPGDEAILQRLARGDAMRRSEEGRWAFLPASEGRSRSSTWRRGIDVPRASAAPLAKVLCAARRTRAASSRSRRRGARRGSSSRDLFAIGGSRFRSGGLAASGGLSVSGFWAMNR